MKLNLPTGYEEVLEDLCPDIQDITEGLDEDTICEVKKTIYGLIQAALKWYKKIFDILRKKLSIKKTREIIICLLVDDSAMIVKRKGFSLDGERLKDQFYHY